MNEWHIKFLELAKHISTWSKDSTKVGAVIADPETHQVLGMGYNGFPRGVEDAVERYDNREDKLKFIVHAEANAILNANRPVRGCDIYVYPSFMLPCSCPECSKLIVQSGIKRVYSYKPAALKDRWQELAKYSKIILEEGGVNCITIRA